MKSDDAVQRAAGDALSFDAGRVVANLPYDFVPTALGALRGEDGPHDRAILSLGQGKADIGDDMPFVVADAADLRAWAGLGDASDSAATATTGALAGRLHRNALTETPLFFGPPCVGAARERLVTFPAPEISAHETTRRALVIVDLAIAFWHPRFSHGGLPDFRAMQFLDFDGTAGTAYPGGLLGPTDIAALCGIAAGPGGQTQIMRHLASQFPGSFYGSGPDPEDFWHGTAIADLAAGDGQADLLFGIELPFAALRDWKGDAFGAILPLALRAALNLTRAVADLPLTVVLPFGFTAGPHDGSHPVAAAITAILAAARRNRTVDLILPMGNQLQDQCCARLQPATLPTASPSVQWHLPPDDFSPNCLEICLTSGAAPKLTLTAPDGRQAEATPGPGTLSLIRSGDTIIGALHRLPDRAGVAKLRLALARTGWTRADTLPAPAGNWRIAIAADRVADFWVLRDDTDAIQDQSRPHRRSYLVDDRYRMQDMSGAYLMTDPAEGVLRRSGTASVLTTASGARTVAALQRWGTGPGTLAYYSGRAFDGADPALGMLVDDGWEGAGVMALVNGSGRRMRVSGTSAAAGLAARLPVPSLV
jgi:hypothetical protein